MKCNYYNIYIWAVYLSLFSFCACNSSNKINRDYVYFQTGGDTINIQQKEIAIRPNDLLGIQIYSRSQNQEQAAVFAIPASANNFQQGYEVNDSGNIELPMIGTVAAAGFTRLELQNVLTQRITPYVKSPSIKVHFLDFNVNILGEVRSPGVHKFLVDKVTIIDALSAAGDLTDFGKRENIIVIREMNRKKISYIVNLTDKSIFKNSGYFMQPNDIVYVSPNKNKLKTLNVDPDVQRRTNLFVTLITFTIGIASFLISILK